MALILNIETASTNCSVSLSKEGKTIALKEDFSQNFSHAERLNLYIDEVIQQAGILPKDLDAIAVSKGPGSYTGLRIGVSTAKGLCFALNIPLISIPTLQSLALQITATNGIVIPMLDARRMEVYSAVYTTDNKQMRDTQAEILDEDSFSTYLEEGIVHFIGTGVDKCQTIIQHTNAVYVERKLPSANNMSVLAYNKYKISDIEDVAYFEPYYLKDFVSTKPKR